MKRLLALVLCIFMLVGTTACKNAENSSSDAAAAPSSQNEDVSSTNSEETNSADSSSVVSDASSNESATSSVASQKPAQNTQSKPSTPTKPAEKVEKLTFDHFMPSVIASRCEHIYKPAGCSWYSLCKLCQEKCRDENYEYRAILLHDFVNSKCTICNRTQKLDDSNLVDLNLSYYATGQEITVDVYVTDLNPTVTLYPCITLEKCIDVKKDIWIPYEGLYEVGEFFALEAKPGGIITSDKGVRYGRWDIMSNEILNTNPDAKVENQLLNRLIRRFKVTFSEPGSYRTRMYDAPNGVISEEWDVNYGTSNYALPQ